MEYGQRSSGIFVRQNLIPQSDLQAENVYPNGQVILPNVHQSLAYLVGQGPYGPRMLQTDAIGDLSVYSNGGYETLPVATRINLVAPRTDTSTYNSADITTPAFTVAQFTLVVTAMSGTAPQAILQIRTKDSQGLYSTLIGGGSSSALTAIGQTVLVISATVAGAASLVGPVIRLSAAITGTTPSVTWYSDLMYK